MAFTPQELEAMPKQFERYMKDLSLNILFEIVERIRAGQEITRTTDYLIYKYDQVAGFNAATKKYIADAVKLSETELNHIFDDVLAEGYARDEELYNAVGSKFVPYKQNESLQEYVEAVKKQTFNELRNISQTNGYMQEVNGKKLLLPTAQVLQDSLDKCINQVMSGATDYNTALNQVCKELTDSDLRSIEYASGRALSVVTVARMCTMTAVAQITGKIEEQNMQKLGTQFVETTAHSTARPNHQLWQGQVFYWDKDNPTAETNVDGVHYKSFITQTDYGSVTGLCGINCYHGFHAFFPGISKRTFTDEELKKLNNDANEKKKYGDKEYTKYQAAQAMRRMENSMRKQRAYIKSLKDGLKPADGQELSKEELTKRQELITVAKARYVNDMHRYQDFASKMKLPQEMERVYYDGLGRM